MSPTTRRTGLLRDRRGSVLVEYGRTRVLVAASVLAVVATRRWSGLSRRFDAPESTASTAPATERGARRTTWDDLSEGRDPTLDPPADPSSGPSDGRGDDPDDGPRSAPV